MSKSKIKPIGTEADYEAALARSDELMNAEPGTPQAKSVMCWPTSWSCMRPSRSRWGIRARLLPSIAWTRPG
jgi:antitoxin component HigA of HigAB toxin-antitoxin module